MGKGQSEPGPGLELPSLWPRAPGPETRECPGDITFLVLIESFMKVPAGGGSKGVPMELL